jgi:hypothetical protein
MASQEVIDEAVKVIVDAAARIDDLTVGDIVHVLAGRGLLVEELPKAVAS